MLLIKISSEIWKKVYGTFGKYTGSDYIRELKEDAKPYHVFLFLFQKFTNYFSNEKLIDQLK